VACGDRVLKLLDLRLFELRDAAAAGADQVVVMIVVVIGELVPRESVAEPALGGDPTLGEELEGPVDGGVANPSVDRANLCQEVLDRHVRRAVEEGVDDEATLRGRPQLLLRHVGVEPLAQAQARVVADGPSGLRRGGRLDRAGHGLLSYAQVTLRQARARPRRAKVPHLGPR